MRRLLLGLAGALLLLAALLLVGASRLESRQLRVEPVEPAAIDAEAVAARLAEALRFRTISHFDRSRMQGAAFVGLHRHLATSYPQLHATLRRELVNEWSLLYTWPGSEPGLEAILLMAHLDVVPVDTGSDSGWEHPPFAGVVAEGQVWGRGSLDDKGSVICILEAVERLAASGFRPRRTVYLAFGHDEELGGDEGSLAIAELLEERGVRLDLVLDEGGAVIEGAIPGVTQPIALVGIAEKGSVTVELQADGVGGHSSVPPRHTAIGRVASAVHRLERSPMPGSIDGATRQMIAYLGPELGFGARVVLGNLWLFGGPIRWGMARDPTLSALIRTTTAATIVEGGSKSNVLPVQARAVVNHRIHPSDDIDAVLAHDASVIDDEEVRLEVGLHGVPRNPSPVSQVDAEAFRRLQRSIGEIFPEALVVPGLLLGGTDARHFHRVSDRVYRLLPFRASRETLKLVHGTNEHLAVELLAPAVHFYQRLIENATP